MNDRKQGIHESVVGTHSKSEKDVRCARALRSLHGGASLLFSEFGMKENEVIAVMAATTANFAEEMDLRSECALVFERWAELLRSQQPIRYTAEGNA